MQPVEPSTIVRGPAAFTMSFMTSADSQPWQVRCPEVKYSSRVTFLTPRKGSRICVAFVNVSAMSYVSYINGSPRTAGPQPRDVLQLALHHSLTPNHCVLRGDLPDFAASRQRSVTL